MSRVDSVKNAIRKISETGLSLEGAIMASMLFSLSQIVLRLLLKQV